MPKKIEKCTLSLILLKTIDRGCTRFSDKQSIPKMICWCIETLYYSISFDNSTLEDTFKVNETIRI